MSEGQSVSLFEIIEALDKVQVPQEAFMAVLNLVGVGAWEE